MSSIRDRKYTHLLNKAFRRLAKMGKFPRFSSVFNMLSSLMGRSAEGSTFDPAKFERGAPFPLEDFNQNLEDIAEEFQLIYDENVYRASQIIESQVITEEFVSELRRQLLKIRENTQRELLLAASNFLDAIVIDFVDRDFIDEANTTANVSTEIGAALLPNRAGARRLAPVSLPGSPIDLEVASGDMIVLPGSSFSDVFTDSLANWQLKTDGQWLRMRSSIGGKLHIGRIQVSTPDEQSTIELRISPDGFNYINVDETKTVRGGLVNFLFDMQPVAFIELIVTKSVPAQSNGHVYTIDTISMHAVGYQPSAVLQTKALVTETGSNIKKATIDLDASIPKHTSITLEVAGGSGAFKPVTNRIISFTDSKKQDVHRTIAPTVEALSTIVTAGGTAYTVSDQLTLVGGVFIEAAVFEVATEAAGVVTSVNLITPGRYTSLPSSPISTTGGTGTLCTLTPDFIEANLFSQPRISGDLGGSPKRVAEGFNQVWGVPDTEFFDATTIPANVDPRYSKLYRENCWGMQSSLNTKVETSSLHAIMSGGETRDIFVPVRDEALENVNALTNVLTVANNIATGASMSVQGTPDSSVIKVTGTFNHGRWVKPVAGPYPVFGVTIVVKGNGATREVYTDDTLTATPDYISDYDSIYIDGVGDVTIIGFDSVTKRIDLDPNTTVTSGAQTLRITKRDLTDSVTIVAGKTITFNKQLREFEKIVVSYNTTMVSHKLEIISSSVEVTSSINAKAGMQGSDFRINGGRLELMVGHALQVSASGDAPIDVKFDYVRKEPDLFSYWTYVVVPEGTNKIINIIPLDLDEDESALWTDPVGKVTDLVGLDTLVMSSGTHRFSVIGRKAVTDHGTLSEDTALYKLVNLAGADSGFVFDPNAQYIERITGYIEPMSLVSRFYLERQARPADGTRFTWEDGVIMSTLKLHDPSDAVVIVPGTTSVTSSADYRLQLRYYNSDGVNSVKIRATLKRDSGADPSKTPILKGITIRFTA